MIVLKNVMIVRKEDFAVIKAKKSMKNAFATIDDGKELTIIIDEKKVDKTNILEISTGWKIITFNIVLPFEMVGFLAKISNELAKNGISIFIISAYSTDHLLIKKESLKRTLEILSKMKI